MDGGVLALRVKYPALVTVDLRVVAPKSVYSLKTDPGLPSWGNREFDREIGKCARIWPHRNDTGGFFMARVRKG